MTKKKNIPQCSQKTFDKKQLQVIFALADLTDKRPEKQIAKAVGVERHTLTRWKHDPGFMKAVDKLLDINIKAARHAVWKKVVSEATGKSFMDRKLFFQLIGEFQETPTVEVNVPVTTIYLPERKKAEKVVDNKKE